ncbi:MAG TPA: N-acetyl-gamma-glutamyl-phosphate reductase [Gemmatimonadaceae bacterium]
MHKIPVAVLGASGYAGRELCALIESHPVFDLAFASANAQRGQAMRARGREITFVAPEDVRLDDVELVFSALPHGASLEWVCKARDAGARVVDLSSDLRPGNGAKDTVPYGLTELTRQQIGNARVVANPGCYPTAILLAIAPLVTSGLALPGAMISICAASGVTGAGFTPRPDLLFAEVVEDFRAYAIGNEHRHLPEMRAMIAELGGDHDLVFTPHLLPVARGILATIIVPLVDLVDNPSTVWRDAYEGEPFIQIVDEPPTLRDVVHRNTVMIHARSIANVREPAVLVIAAIDNLVKGAAGQALQNANLMSGLDETMGLPA